MKKIVIIGIAAISFLVGCKKSNPSPAVAIIGKWYYSSLRFQTLRGETIPVYDTTYTVFTGQFVQFNSDGTGILYMGIPNPRSVDFSYSVSGGQESETDVNVGVPMVYTIAINGSTMTRHIKYMLLTGYTYIEDDTMHK
jgi:hypothetical protein